MLIGHILAHVDFLDAEQLDARLEGAVRPFR
jgi:hypothetical protein